ncbi:unnamed protein product [Heligmosomoides polygyrus]|uniref:DUF1893 domain-containing protein n=1 Tax=Heligmosomoides polygyrus TaxID=6339 RepID=A0A183FDJ1_HELPZ|nr:unnamed protein product [Heligmosomoides polygyrus]
MLTTSCLLVRRKPNSSDRQGVCDRVALFALKLNVNKTEFLTTVVNKHGSIKINGTGLSQVSSLKYLLSTVNQSGGRLKLDVNACVSGAWPKWCSLTGVLCAHFKSMVYGTVVRPIAMYGAEYWPVMNILKAATV